MTVILIIICPFYDIFFNDFSIDDVADSFTLKFGTSIRKRIINKIKKFLLLRKM